MWPGSPAEVVSWQNSTCHQSFRKSEGQHRVADCTLLLLTGVPIAPHYHTRNRRLWLAFLFGNQIRTTQRKAAEVAGLMTTPCVRAVRSPDT